MRKGLKNEIFTSLNTSIPFDAGEASSRKLESEFAEDVAPRMNSDKFEESTFLDEIRAAVLHPYTYIQGRYKYGICLELNKNEIVVLYCKTCQQAKRSIQ